MGAAWLVPFAHGTPTMMLWSFDVRSWEPIQATPLRENERAWKEWAGVARPSFLLAERAR
jgi:hypothetical protein